MRGEEEYVINKGERKKEVKEHDRKGNEGRYWICDKFPSFLPYCGGSLYPGLSHLHRARGTYPYHHLASPNHSKWTHGRQETITAKILSSSVHCISVTKARRDFWMASVEKSLIVCTKSISLAPHCRSWSFLKFGYQRCRAKRVSWGSTLGHDGTDSIDSNNQLMSYTVKWILKTRDTHADRS